MALSSVWARLPQERLVGLGYCTPFLDRFRADTERTMAFMPAHSVPEILRNLSLSG